MYHTVATWNAFLMDDDNLARQTYHPKFYKQATNAEALLKALDAVKILPLSLDSPKEPPTYFARLKDVL